MKRKVKIIFLCIFLIFLSGCGSDTVVNKLKAANISGFYIYNSDENRMALSLIKINTLQYAVIPYTASQQDDILVWENLLNTNLYFYAELKPSKRIIELYVYENYHDEDTLEYIGIDNFIAEGKFNIEDEDFFFELEDIDDFLLDIDEGKYYYSNELPQNDDFW